MTPPPINILGIAPYDGIASMMKRSAQKREDLNLDVYVGNLEQGVEIVKKNLNSHYDVIISRGGTAELIARHTTLPVIEISLSVYDILRAIKLAENYSSRYAIVGFSAITSSAHLLCDLLQYQVDIFTLHHENEVLDTLSHLKEQGYHMVLCDVITHITARRLDLNAILITSGTESIETSFDEAIKLCHSYHTLKNEVTLYKELLLNSESELIVYDQHQQLIFSTLTQSKQLTSSPELDQILLNEIPETLSVGSRKFFKTIDKSLYAFSSKCIPYENETYIAFYLNAAPLPLSVSKYGIKYSSKQDIDYYTFNSLYSVVNGSTKMQTIIQQMNNTHYPIMIIGEPGTGKGQAANMLYAQSDLCTHSLITINCALLTDKSWSFITNHYNSPLIYNDNTLYFQNLDALSKEQSTHLLSLILDTNLCTRNRLIFSTTCTPSQDISAVCVDYINVLSCITHHLKPLRQVTDQIPALSSLYLNTLNLELAKQIIGLEPEALTLMKTYSWPYNYTQFKRILKELCTLTDSSYIAYDTLKKLLSNEHSLAPATSSQAYTYNVNINRPLNDIIQDIIHMVLEETNGNQSAAARRLNIGRTTLWRYISSETPAPKTIKSK